MNATREQLLAMTSDRHCVVSASAGSGKTTVLVDRYVQLILGGTDVRHIAAITFTRKAAAEMLARATEAVERRLSAETIQEKMRKLKETRERLTSARISTIHSFCGRLLREYPIEADVPPNFTEQSEYEAAQMRRASAEEALIEFLSNNDSKEQTSELFRILGNSTPQYYLEIILANREKLFDLHQFYAQSDEQCLQSAERASIEIILPIIKNASNAVSAMLAQLDNLQFSGKQSDFFLKTISTNERIRELLRELNGRDALCEAMRLLSSNELPAFTKSGELKKVFADKILSAPQIQRDDIQSGFQLAESLVATASDGKLDLDIIRMGRALHRIAERAADIIEEKKIKSGELDFDDLMMKCLKLLDNETVCKKIRRKIKYLMIDEFQDTNALQYNIAKRIANAIGAQNSEDDATNIYIVGDAKQSIYGFRGADVRVFDSALNDIMAANARSERAGKLPQFTTIAGSRIEMNNSERYGDIRITASFRLSPAIAAFVNKVCETVMPNKSIGYEVGYDKMVCARKSMNANDDYSSVVFLVCHKRKNSSAASELSQDNTESVDAESAETDGDNLNEAFMLAGHIVDSVAGSNPLMITSGSNEQPRPVKFGDFAILMRNRTNIDNLSKALRAKNIPFIIHGGSGFYSTQEITDVGSYLSFLHNPNNDIALAGVLRSPFFGVSDAGLYAVASGDPNLPLWQKLQNYEAIQNFAADYFILRARRLLLELLPLASRLPIPILIRRLIERSGWSRIVSGNERAEQMESNIEKLIGIAREFERKGFRNLYDFAEELALLAESEAKESEAAITSGADAVNIMTIHASKGLEFPIVALYDSNSKSKNTSLDIDLSNMFGACFDAAVNIDGYSVRRPALISKSAELLKKQSEMSEEKRLLYVALTRAKDHLVISASVRHKSGGNAELYAHQGFFKLIMQGIGFDNYELFFNHHIENLYYEDMPFLVTGETVATPCKIPTRVIVETPTLNAINFKKATNLFPRKINADIISTKERDIVFSASQIMLFEKDETEYILRYRLGMPTDNDFEITSGVLNADEDNDTIIGTFAGSMIHEVLSEIQVWIGNKPELGSMANRIAAKSERALAKELFNRAVKECINVEQTELITLYKQRLPRAKIEHEFQLPVGDDFLFGKLDVLIQDENGLWEIWDWKTNRIYDDNELDDLAAIYRRQLQVYAILCANMFPEQEFFTARLLFTRNAKAAAKHEEWTRVFVWSRDDINDFSKEIYSIMQRIKAVC